MRNSHKFRAGVVAMGVAALLAGNATPTSAHEIPARVAVIAFVRPAGQHLRLVVRVPLEAMRDIAWPLRGPGYLQLDKVDSLLAQAAKTWIADYVQLFENDRKLGDARLIATRVSLPS